MCLYSFGKLSTNFQGELMPNRKSMNRRQFFRTSFSMGAAVLGATVLGKRGILHADEAAPAIPDLVAIKGGEPDVMFQKAIAALGGMEQYVKKGQTVVVKPNIGWNREPETGADTNPMLVKNIVEACLAVGAVKVYVFDHTCNDWEKSYKSSQIEQYAKNAGATVVPAHAESYYEEVRIAGAKILKTAKVHELILDSDVLINVPVLKHNGSSRLTIAMKNLMGVVWDRGFYHYQGLHECIADFCLYRKPDLNIVDAYRITMDHGPNRARPEDVVIKKNLLISKDIVAVDAAAAKIWGTEPENVEHIRLASEKNVGQIDLNQLNIARISLS
jgi:uncharacterized protein (DUF362 family)